MQNLNFFDIFIKSFDNNLKLKNNQKSKNSESQSHEETITSPIGFEISNNASKFAVFSSIRSLVLEHETKYKILYKLEKHKNNHLDKLKNDEIEFKISDLENHQNIPLIVSAGIQTLFDIISETKQLYPSICSKALASLFDIFQGQDPEGFKSEPDALFQSLFELLLDLATHNLASPQKSIESNDECNNWCSIACSSLLSLIIARGDTGKIIKAITSILMSSNAVSNQQIKLPEILIKLQESVECAALGKPEKPTFFEYGIPQNSLIDEFFVKNITFESYSSSSLASDGKFLYILLGKSLYKVGTGYNGTSKGFVYKMNRDFTKDKRGWIGFCKDKLYYKKLSKRNNDSFVVVDRENLTFLSPIQTYKPKTLKKDSTNYTLYSDGECINAIYAIRDDNFIIKEVISSTDYSFDLTLNLAKRSFRTFGYAAFEEEILNNTQLQKIQSTFNCFVPTLPDDSEINGIEVGKEFGLVVSSTGKVYYYGKSSSLGLKSLIKSPSLKLSELTISKVSKIVQISIGHDGLHTLLLSDDGSVYFAGTVRRGEDGENSKRRLLKPTKPKRISRLDNHYIVNISSNNGTSAFVTKAGKLIMFGKDTSFCDTHGVVTQLQDQHITKISLGKAHAVALNAKGQIFTFGVNNKGQCGRIFSSYKDSTQSSNDDFMGKSSNRPASHLCEIDEHEVVEENCKICKMCHECTGYNKSCAAIQKIPLKNRIPGSNCFCGSGNSGCTKCGICSLCILKQENDINNRDLSKKEVTINVDEINNFANDSERDAQRVAPLPPAKIHLPSSSPIVQIACGLHHTVVLTLAGEVYTFGSNQFGQLGTGDLQPVSTPVNVKLPGVVQQIAAGSNHTVVLTTKGIVYTFGNYQKGQLGRLPTDMHMSIGNSNLPHIAINKNDTFLNLNECQADSASNILIQRQRFLWNCIPSPISGIGPNYRKKACWITASGDQTFIKIDESLVNANSLGKISVAANKNTIIFISNSEGAPGCITINKQDGKCKTHINNQYLFNNYYYDSIYEDIGCDYGNIGNQNEKLSKENNDFHQQFSSSSSSSPSSSIAAINNTVFAFDPLYDLLWCFDATNKKMLSFNIVASKSNTATPIFRSDIKLPNKNVMTITRSQACLNILACLDTLAASQNVLDKCFEVDLKSKTTEEKTPCLSSESVKESKESRKICRFEAFGGGWGYFGHSVEAIRFMCDTDIIMDGIGLYGGRGEYTCKIKIYDLGVDGGGYEKDGTLIIEIEDVPYYCPARTIHNIYFPKPVNVIAGKWYLLWVKVSGPSSDCGSSGQSIVVGDDQVVFTFKSSKKSNNGTDINSGQIPSILYRVVAHDRKLPDTTDKNETACKISKNFINTISCESFENLVKLLNWSWNQFKSKFHEFNEKLSSSDELLLNRFVYINQVCLKLLKKYINEIYPSESFRYVENEKSTNIKNNQNEISKQADGKIVASTSTVNAVSNQEKSSTQPIQSSRKNNMEKINLAECIGNVRALLIRILCDDSWNVNSVKASAMYYSVLDECIETFVSCFNAFYPTSYLKWDCLCDLLSQMDKGIMHSRLLSGILAGLCDPTVNLKSTFSIVSPYSEQKSITSPSDNYGFPILQSSDNYNYPILVEQMIYRTQKEKVNVTYGNWNFKDILVRLLDIISRPIRLKIESVYSNTKLDFFSNEYLKKTSNFNLLSNCCHLLSKILAEIVYQSCTADTDTTVISPYSLQSTGIRFKKCDFSKTWNTGNFGSDAICFTVDRPGIVLAGACVYYGSGSYDYQLELLHDTLDSKTQMQHKWEILESTYGTFDQDNVHRNMVQIKFERPIPLKENVCYAIRYCAQGARTCSGDSGYPSVRGPCGTIFRFYPCDLSFNGTTPARGQIPSLLYYSVPINYQNNKMKNSKEIYARDISLEIASDIIHRSRDLLILAKNALLYTLSSSSDKSSTNSSNTTQAFDSEHNITPIEEHFDISWVTTQMTGVPSSSNQVLSSPYYATSSKDSHINTSTKDITKRIETFSRGLIETLKFDKKVDRNPIDLIEIDVAAKEITANDVLNEDTSSKIKLPMGSNDLGQLNGNQRIFLNNELTKSESEDSLQNIGDKEKLNEIFTVEESSLFHTLLPLTVSHISRLICSDPKVSVEILNMVKSILPHISSWNQICSKSGSSPAHVNPEKSSNINTPYELCTTSNYYTILESDHPYKNTSIYSYKVEFPSSVKWMSIEFDPQCGTSQPEDCLKIFIPPNLNPSLKSNTYKTDKKPASKVKVHSNVNSNEKDDDTVVTDQNILIKKFNTESGWSTNAIIIPGNEILLSMETASNYLMDHKLNRYGFKCIVIGYENINESKSFNNSLLNLESEFTYLGGMCSANLMRKDLIFSDEKSDDFWATENTLKKHSILLSKGLSIQNGSLSINNILDYDIAIDSEQSHEKQFLKDFVFVVPDSAGGRLASWIQPESRLDPNRCELKLFQDPIQSGWPTKLVIETRDQYGEIVYVPNIRIQLKVALNSNISNEKRYHKLCKDPNVFMALGKVVYEPVIKEKEKICLKSITAMKAYSQYSFEEMRLYTPLQNKTSDVLTAKDSGDQSYSVLWTPECAGSYVINIIIDGVQINEVYNIKVIDADVPPPVKEHALKKIQPQYKYRKFYAEFTSGLRIRLHPTLQAEQIGIIKVNEIISFIDEVENNDGIWVKLSTDSIRKYCSSAWYPSEAWCLQYNQHLEKRLLFPLIESTGSNYAIDEMNNVQYFDEVQNSTKEYQQCMEMNINKSDVKIEDARPNEESLTKLSDGKMKVSENALTNQSNITAAIAGVVEGGANKLQAFQKWLKRDSIGDTTATIKKRIGSIPELYNNNTLDLKNTRTDNIDDKLSNDISVTSPVQEKIIPTNNIFSSKINQNEFLIFRGMKKTQSDQKVNKSADEEDNIESNVCPKQALSPSIAETVRAIFAAFLWHEGLVHDAIACASFLKFHPTIPKSNIYFADQFSSETLTKDEKIQQRHSVEIANTSNYLNARPSTLEALTKSGYCCVHYRKQRSKIGDHRNEFKTSGDDWNSQHSGLPPALRCLIYVWDELQKEFQNFISKNISEKESKDLLILPKAGFQAQLGDNNEFDHPKKTKIKKLLDDSNTPLGAAAVSIISGEKEVGIWCELCNIDINVQLQQNQLTQHMKTSHPGCGESTKGKGYNSNGIYCDGWAGKCGEEGIGATSWYLLCESCREKYLNLKKRLGSNINDGQMSKTPSTREFPTENQLLSKTFPTKKLKYNSTINMEIFDAMKENALFLLDLNSHNGGILNKTTANNLIPTKNKINNRHSSVSEYISHPNTSIFQHRLSATNILEEQNTQKKIQVQKQNSLQNYFSKKLIGLSNGSSNTVPDLLWTPPEGITCLDFLNAKLNESESCNIFSMDNEKTLCDTTIIQNNNKQQDIANQEARASAVSENRFHRSFSMIQGLGYYSFNPNDQNLEAMNYEYMSSNNVNIPQNNDQNKVVMRRKKTCQCDSGSEASLLNFPSKNLKKLVPLHIINPSLKAFKEVSSSHDIERELENASESKMHSGTFELLQNCDEPLRKSSFLTRPTITFIFEKHDLDKLRYLLRKNLRKAICSVYGLQALNWLLRTVTQAICVHDIMWWFVSSLTQTKGDNESSLKLEDSDVSYEHPVAISNIDDRIQHLLSQSLHLLLQSIADITLSLPSGSALQRLAIQCFGIKFKPTDHQFLHNSHVFGNISKILSKSEEFNEENLLYSTNGVLETNAHHNDDAKKVVVKNFVDITDVFEFVISSRQAMISALTDNSTETFWESDDDDRNKPKIIEISMSKPNYVCRSINIHIDNCRDLAHKITSFTVYGGASLGELNMIETVESESNIGSWYTVVVKDDTKTHFRIELRGIENNIRIRQVKLLGYSLEQKPLQEQNYEILKYSNAHYIQQKYCELETLRVFRVLTNQVFGKLIISNDRPSSFFQPAKQNYNAGAVLESHIDSPSGDSLDLREHMVGILFSRSKLTHLQKQIIVHIVHSIQKETQKCREEWEYHLSTSNVAKSSISNSETIVKSNDVYCFEMLSMVLALSGSAVGRSYLSHQNELLKDVFVLLHTGSERVQRQVILLLRRILPEISPETLCNVLEIEYPLESDITNLLQNPKVTNPQKMGILDILLAIIAKSLQIQVKFKNNSSNKNLNCKLSDYILPPAPQSITASQKYTLSHHYQHQFSSGTEVGSTLSGSSKDYDSIKSAISLVKEEPKRWFLCGNASIKLAENIISLIKDMISGKLSDKWSQVTKVAVAECIINLAHLDEINRQPETCLKTPTIWLALASLCVLDEDHVVKLSSGQWSNSGEKRPLCINHDDSITSAVIECNECGTLCCDCDRFLHLNRKTWIHRRTVCKEEEESIKVELHESCGRIKLFWLLSLTDSKTLKGIIEFRDGHNIIICDPQNAVGRCRFCGVYGNTGLLAVGNVCVEEQCQEYSANACSKILSCGHWCAGISNEPICPPCLQPKCQSISQIECLQGKKPKLTQDGDDMCMICFSEALSCAPSIQLNCGHVFHYHCCRTILQKRWHGARISFAFSQCPICKNDICHDSLNDLLEPISSLKEDVRRKALMRLKYEGVEKELVADHKDLTNYAMDRYAYYVCSKCQKAYYGGEARCDAEMGENFNPEELVCGGCSDVAKAQMCPKHGMDFLEYKCRYCCSVAVFFCFGTTHFCDSCHDDFQRLTNIPKIKLPKCPVGPKATQLMADECPLHIVHPPTGEEFALGCGICRNFHTF